MNDMYAQLIMLFALIFTGMGLCKIGILNKTVNLGINKMTLYFAFPCMIAYKLGTMEMDPSLIRDFVTVIVLGLLVFAVFTILVQAYYRLRGLSDKMTRPGILSTILPNNAFIGYPVALAVYGQPGLLMMIAHGAIVSNIYNFTYVITYFRREKAERTPLTVRNIVFLIFELIRNPIIISIPVGLAILYFKIPMDNIVGDYLSMISQMASPLAMIYTGAAIGEGDILEAFRDKRIWEISLLKLIVVPLITGLMIYWLPVSALVKVTMILGSAFPCAAISVMLGQQEGLDYSQAAKAMLLSTILSVVTLSVVLGVLTRLFPLGV